MAGAESLPRFHEPPIDEVVVGIQFPAIEQITVVQGLFYGRVKGEFPTVFTQPAYPPYFEMVSEDATPAPPMSAFPPFFAPISARAVYVSHDESALIQLQSDRLLFNWRKRADAYPHFRNIQQSFWLAHSHLLAVTKEFGVANLLPNQCDVGYVNMLGMEATGFEASQVSGVLRPWTTDFSPEWGRPMEDLSFTARYRIFDRESKPAGRLNVILGTHVDANARPFLRLDLMARGRPFGEGDSGVTAFQEHAHETIVECFAAITQPAMHNRWKRYQ